MKTIIQKTAHSVTANCKQATYCAEQTSQQYRSVTSSTGDDICMKLLSLSLFNGCLINLAFPALFCFYGSSLPEWAFDSTRTFPPPSGRCCAQASD